MKYKKIVLLFGIALPISILLRILQLMFTVELNTGFLKQEYKSVGFYLLILIFVSCLTVAIFSFMAHRSPEKPPKPNLALSAASFLLGLTIGYNMFTVSFSKIVRNWQLTLFTTTGFFAALFFLIYGLKFFIKIKIPKICYIIPSLFMIIMIICSFTSISSLSLITDNVMLMASFCVTLLFMICFAKLYNQIDLETNFRKIMAAGFSASILCFAQSIPHIIINLVTKNGYLHTSHSMNLLVLMTGVFILVFTFSYFSYKNVALKRHHRKKDPKGQELYM